MRFRLFAGAMLVCALAVAQGVPFAGAAPKRVFKGKTAQKRSVKLTVHGRTLQLRHFKAQLNCRDGSTLIVDESGFQRTRIRSNGKFKDVQVGSTDEVFFKGRATGRVVRGKIRVKDRLKKGGPRCTSRWIKFRAKRGGGNG
jgi:hypothetical protein